MEQQSDNGGSGVLKFVGIGCLVVIVVPGVIAFLAWQKFQAVGGLDGMIQAGGGQAVEIVLTKVASELLEGMKIPEGDREAILAPLKGLGDKIANGDINMVQVEEFADSIAEGPIFGVLITEGFAHGYLQASGLSGDEMTRSAPGTAPP